MNCGLMNHCKIYGNTFVIKSSTTSQRGLRRCNTSSTSCREHEPSKASGKISMHHSAIPDALDKHCASPAKVKDTTLGSLYDFQPTKLTGLSTPSGNFLSVRAINEPPCVLSLTAFAEAASDQEQTVRSWGSM